MEWDGAPDIPVTGRFGDGVLGPFEEVAEVAEVNDECPSPFVLRDDPVELCLGEEAPEEYASDWCSGIDGSLSLVYGGRWVLG